MGNQKTVQQNRSIRSVQLLKDGVRVDNFRFGDNVFLDLNTLQELEEDHMTEFMQECMLHGMEGSEVARSFFEVIHVVYSLYRELQKPVSDQNTGRQ